MRAGAAGEEAEAVAHALELGPNESVTPASNQQIIPALAPKRTTPLSHASRRIASKPCTRQIASMFAVLPPLDRDRVLGEHELAQARGRPRVEAQVRQLAEPGEALVERDDPLGASRPTAVGTWRTRGRSLPVSART